MRTQSEISQRMTDLQERKIQLNRNLLILADNEQVTHTQWAIAMIDEKLEEYFWLMQPIQLDKEFEIAPYMRVMIPDDVTETKPLEFKNNLIIVQDGQENTELD